MIHWLKYKKIYFAISGLLVAASIFSIAVYGFNPGIDFTGGSLVEIRNEKGEIRDKKVKEVFAEEKIEIEAVQKTEDKGIVIKTYFIPQDKAEKIKQLLEATPSTYNINRFENVGPTLGKELLTKTLKAAILAVLGMLFYIAWAFKNIRFGAAAVLALLHDTIILLGSFAFLGHFLGVEVDALFVTAVLTSMSFSVHDTVVVFNKIREKPQYLFNKQKQKQKGDEFEKSADIALTETMVRSINNSLTIAFMLLALFLLGGENIRWFIAALFVGTILGTYSSPFVAVPILSLLQKKHSN